MVSLYVLPGIRESARLNTAEYVTQRVLTYFKSDMKVLRARRRDRDVIIMRSILAYYLYYKCNWRLKDIVDFFKPGVTHHTTVIHSLRGVEDQLSLKNDNEISMHMKNIGL
jgi:chromosomal replication initiation ATPase DnaA